MPFAAPTCVRSSRLSGFVQHLRLQIGGAEFLAKGLWFNALDFGARNPAPRSVIKEERDNHRLGKRSGVALDLSSYKRFTRYEGDPTVSPLKREASPL